MEELRSTEILDKEIEDDARKKAVQILEHADEECRQILDAVEGRVQAMAEERKADYEAKLRHFRRSVDASAPLEELRFLASFKMQGIMQGIDAYLAALPKAKRAAIIDGMIEKYAPVFEGKKYTRTEVNEASVFPEISVSQGVILASEDGSISARATLDEKIAEILDSHSHALAAALFGRRLPV
jgi:V/A-type H+-transporting ATPase subunit E